MLQIPVLHEVNADANSVTSRGKPIIELKELEPDWERYNAWRASLVESYASWLERRKKFRLDDTP